MFVAHGTDLHALVSFSVSLSEKLHHDAVCPLPVQLEGLCGVAQVCTVHHVLKDLRQQESFFVKKTLLLHLSL